MRVANRTGLSARLVRALAAAAVAAALQGLLVSCATPGTATGAAAAANASNDRAITLNNIDTLKSLFNRDHGHTRLILIFSPT